MALRMRALRVECVAKPSAKQLKAPVAARNVALTGLVSSLLLAQPARAEDAVDTTVAAVTEAVKATGSAVRTGLDVLGSAAKALKEGYDVASPYIQSGVEAVTPAVKEAVKVTSDVAGPAIQKAVPIVQDTLTGAIKSTGVDLDTVSKTTSTVAKTAADGATAAQPLLSKAAAFLSSASPLELGEYGLGALALYLLAPPLLGGVAGGLRGYAGDITAVQALDALNSGDTLIVDIRTEKEKETSGVPDLPGGGSKLVELELYSIADRKLRGSLRDAGYIESQVTALQIASLKRVSKGSKVILLDRNGSASKSVARELAKRGFGRVFVVDGGFDGWVRSKLLVKPTAGAALQPLPSIARTISSRQTSRKALPAPSK